jgi:hypothetical protein
VIIFDSVEVFIKKINKPKFKKKKTETGSNRPGSVQFFRTKTGSNWFGLVFFRFGSVRFFGFRLIKPKPNRTEPVGFFKILIGLIVFFHGSVFSVIFSWFSWFFGFFAHPY